MRVWLNLLFTLLFILSAQAETSGSDATRSVTDQMGRNIKIPLRPKRIVANFREPVLTIPLIELGVDPIASSGRNDDGTVNGVDFIDSVLATKHPKPTGYGLNGQIDLEKLHALKPDLIIGSEYDIGKVEQLSTIAPVYLQKIPDW